MPVVVRRVVIPLDSPCEQARLKRPASVLVAARDLPLLLALCSTASALGLMSLLSSPALPLLLMCTLLCYLLGGSAHLLLLLSMLLRLGCHYLANLLGSPALLLLLLCTLLRLGCHRRANLLRGPAHLLLLLCALLCALQFTETPGLSTLLSCPVCLLLSLHTLLFTKPLGLNTPGISLSPFSHSRIPPLLSSSPLTAQCTHLE